MVARAVWMARARDVAGWILLAALVFAPWAKGSLPPLALLILEILLSAAAFVWLTGRGAGGVPPALLVLVAILLFIGWTAALNPHARYDYSSRQLQPIASPWPALPGTVDQAISLDAMSRVTALLAALCLAADLGRFAIWRRRIIFTIALAGCSVAVHGLLERASPVHWMQPFMSPHEGRWFATFNYHGNAGAFLNLCLPAIVAMALLRRGWQRAMWLALAAICLAAMVVNVSRAAQFVGLLEILALALAWMLLRKGQPPRAAGYARAGAAAAIFLLLAAIGGGSSMQRWARLPRQLTLNDSRGLLWGTSWAMAKDAGPFGFGPGTYKILMPISPHFNPEIYGVFLLTWYQPHGQVSMWNEAHQDYLQTLIEWGWIGGALWAILIMTAIAGLCRPLPGAGVSDAAIRLAALVAIAGVLVHALVDFPLEVASLQLYVCVYLGLGYSAWRRADY